MATSLEQVQQAANTEAGHGVPIDPDAQLPPGTITAHGVVGPDGRLPGAGAAAASSPGPEPGPAPETPEQAAEAVLGPPPAELPRLSREQVLAAPDRPEQVVDVPEWGGSVKIRALSLEAFRRIQASNVDAAGELDSFAAMQHVLVEGIVEPELEPADVQAMGQRSVAPVSRLAVAIVRLSGADDSFIQAAEAAFRH